MKKLRILKSVVYPIAGLMQPFLLHNAWLAVFLGTALIALGMWNLSLVTKKECL